MPDWSQKKSVWCYDLQPRGVHVTGIRDQAPKGNHQAPAGEGSLLVTSLTSTATTQRNGGGSAETWPFPFSFGVTSLLWIVYTAFGFLEPRNTVVENGEFLEYKGFRDMLPAYFISMTRLKTAVTLSPTLPHTPSFSSLRKSLVGTAPTEPVWLFLRPAF